MRIIKKPIVTEKSLGKYKDQNKVTFEVDMNTDKIKASKLIEELYSVKVISAVVSTRLGKYKYNRLSKRFGTGQDKKIMVFKLDSKSKIDLFETK